MMHQDADVVIVGAGAAGLVTALSARGRRVTIITPDPGDGSTEASQLAQGGIAAAVGRGDSPLLHLQDTLRAAGAGVDIAAARYLCHQAPASVSYLDSLGVRFAREGNSWALHTEAAHSRPRVLHVGDATGASIMFDLRRAIAAATHVELLPYTRAVGLLRTERGVCGVSALSADGRQLALRARAVVIATGGVGGLFARSTNPIDACGEGIAMALLAGAKCRDLEFVQFHPTALDVDARPLPLITEALRGAGAALIDEDGRSIMAGTHPLGDLAPRDVVARGVYMAQQQGRRVLLDATRIDHCDVTASFPSVSARLREYGFDLRREPVPVTPAAHYHMGGIAVDLDGRTSLSGLWAVGEAACTGVHGANRLASNSLLETVVFGRRLGRALAREHLYAAEPRPAVAVEYAHLPDADAGRELREVMWRCMGVVRSAGSIAKGLGFVARLREQTPPARRLDHARLLLAQAMLLAAARCTGSCGAHFRSDAIAPALAAAG